MRDAAGPDEGVPLDVDRSPAAAHRRRPMTGTRVTALDPAGYGRSPWKNGGGVTTDIAYEYHPGAAHDAWGGILWRFGRTAIPTDTCFSDVFCFHPEGLVVFPPCLVL